MSALLKDNFPDGEFWIVTEEGDVAQVSYYREASFWLKRDVYARSDGEEGSWELNQIAGWTHSEDDAEKAAAELLADCV
jgi:hypothetical protein